jgi:hypothetical protein
VTVEAAMYQTAQFSLLDPVTKKNKLFAYFNDPSAYHALKKDTDDS